MGDTGCNIYMRLRYHSSCIPSCNFDPLQIRRWHLFVVFSVRVCRQHSSLSALTMNSWFPFTILPARVTLRLIPAHLLPSSTRTSPTLPEQMSKHVNWFKPESASCNNRGALIIIIIREQLRAEVCALCLLGSYSGRIWCSVSCRMSNDRFLVSPLFQTVIKNRIQDFDCCCFNNHMNFQDDVAETADADWIISGCLMSGRFHKLF